MTEPKPTDQYEVIATPAGIDALGLLDMLRPWAGTPIPDEIPTRAKALELLKECLLEMARAVQEEENAALRGQVNRIYPDLELPSAWGMV